MFPWRLICDKPVYDLVFIDYLFTGSLLRDYVPVPTLAAVLRAVSEEYGVGADVLSQKGVRGSEARQCLIYLASTWCRGTQTLTRVSESVGLSLGGLTSGAHKFRQRLQSCPALRQRVEAVTARLSAAEIK